MITIQVYFCHTVKQAEKIVKLIRESERFDKYVIFHTCRYNFYEEVCKPGDLYESIDPPIHAIAREKNRYGLFGFDFYDEMSKSGLDFDGAHIEVDLTQANVEESFSVCWVSAALDLNAYIIRNVGKTQKKIYFDSVPRFADLPDIDADIISKYQNATSFTNLDVKKDLFPDLSDITISRSTSSLTERGLLEITKGSPTRMPGREYRAYQVTDAGIYMLSMNNRSKNRPNFTSKKEIEEACDRYVRKCSG